MKKLISTLALIAIMVVLTTTMVSAATSSSLLNDLYALGSKYGVTNADKLKLEKILKAYPVTDAQAEQIYAKAQEVVKILDEAGVTSAKKLSTQLTKAQKQQVRAICQEAADILGLKLTYVNGTVEVYKDGTLIEVFTFTDTLPYTGNNINTILVSSVAVLALDTGLVAKRKLANA